MKKKLMIALCGAAAAAGAWFGHAQSRKPDPPAIQIEIGADKAVRVTIPNLSKPDLVGLISAFFSKGDEQAKTNFNAVIGKSSAVTLVLTTEAAFESNK